MTNLVENTTEATQASAPVFAYNTRRKNKKPVVLWISYKRVRKELVEKIQQTFFSPFNQVIVYEAKKIHIHITIFNFYNKKKIGKL